MQIYSDYSRYYDLLYRDKDYRGEADLIETLICEYAPNAEEILELGCGTGRHASLLAEKGYVLHGVDASDEMLSVAKKLQQKDKVTFSKGDVRTVRLNKKFDVVISLFHVMSYQTTNEDLTNAICTAYEHLSSNGIFIFDCWYGPAVLTDRPSVRIKKLDDNDIEITRIAEPVMHPNENIVEVNYEVLIRNKNDSTLTVLYETHNMRYLFRPEVEAMLNRANFQLISCEEWISRNKPGFQSWNVTFVAKK